MYKEVVLKTFKKAKREISGKTTKTQISEYISSVLLNDFKIQVSGRTLRNLYDEAINVSEKKDISVNSIYINELCKYLGYNDYNYFIKESNLDSNNSLVLYMKKHWVVILICFVALSSSIGFVNYNHERWMIWDGDKYVEVDFDSKKYSLNQLKLLDKEMIDNFYKTTPNCETSFFTEDGIEKLWYSKNKNGDLECYSSLGKHPKTGKTLKPITRYMIKKYICNSY